MLESIRNLPRNVLRRYQPGVWLVSVVGVLNSIAISLSLPFLALYLFEQRGVSMAMVGVIILICGLCTIVAQLLAGVITDKLGRRPLLMVTMSSSVILYVGMAVAIGLSAPIIVIVIFYALVRSTLGMQRPAMQSIVADLAPKEQLTETYGLMIIGGNLGFAAGPALGGYLASSLTYAWIFGLGAAIIGIAFIIVIFGLKESFRGSTERVSISSIFTTAKDRNLLAFTLTCMLLFLVSSQLVSTLSVYTVSYAGFTTAQFGTLLTLNGLMITILQYPASLLMSRMPLAASLVIGAILYSIGYLTMAWVGSYGLAFFGVAVITSGEIFCTPSIMTVVGRLASANWRGRYMAFFSVSDSLGMSLGPLMGGFLLDRFHAQPLIVWGVPAILAVLAAAGFSRFGAKAQNRQVEKAQPGIGN